MDTVEQALDEILNRLCDNLMNPQEREALQGLRTKTKEHVVKDRFLTDLHNFIAALNGAFEDIKFLYRWENSFTMYEGCKHVSEYYDGEFFSDEDDIAKDLGCEPYDVPFYEESLQELTMRLSYYHSQKCSLGHTHVKHRFYVCNIPRILDLIGYWKVGMPIRTLVKEFLPDFFYDPTEPAKGKKKRAGNSTKRAK